MSQSRISQREGVSGFLWSPGCLHKEKFHHGIADCSSSNNSWMHKLKRVGLKLQLSLTPYPCVKDLDFYCLIYSLSLCPHSISPPCSLVLYICPQRKKEAVLWVIGMGLSAGLHNLVYIRVINTSLNSSYLAYPISCVSLSTK